MARRTAWFLVGLLAIASCGSRPPSGEGIDGYWTLTEIRLEDERIEIPDEARTRSLPDSPMWMRFSEAGITGEGPCNGFSGNYSTTGDLVGFSDVYWNLEVCDRFEEIETAVVQFLRGQWQLQYPSTRSMVLSGPGLQASFDRSGTPDA